MHSKSIHSKTRFSFRPVHCVLAVSGLLFAVGVSYCQRASDEVVKPGMERIDQEEGARRLEAFRQQRLQGDYVFEFQLEHKPRRARTVRFDGIMWGSWNERGAVTRLKVLPRNGGVDESSAPIELIIQNGTQPEAWIRRGPSEAFQQVEGDALFEPLLPGLVYSVFDLQMPFIYWDEYDYEGPSLVGASRVAQNFLMRPPEESASERQGIQGVRVSLDDTYNALWRVEVIGDDGDLRSKFSVESFKKVQEQYIVKRITLVDYPSKDRTTFDVTDANVGIHLDRDLFELPPTSPARP
jgi:hypothetical protein